MANEMDLNDDLGKRVGHPRSQPRKIDANYMWSLGATRSQANLIHSRRLFHGVWVWDHRAVRVFVE